MLAYFIDSSAIVKRYVSETGTLWIAGVTDQTTGARVYVASITGAEVVSAITRKQRGGQVGASDAAAALSQFHQDYIREFNIVAITQAVINRAMALAATYGLRGYDAVQLAASLETNIQRLSLGAAPLTLISADLDLLAAGVAEGLTTDDPNAH